MTLFNTALPTLLVYLIKDDMYGSPSLIEEVSEDIVILLLWPPVTNVVNALWKYYNKMCVKCFCPRNENRLKEAIAAGSRINQL